MGMPDRPNELPQINELPQRELGWPPDYGAPGGDPRAQHGDPPRDHPEIRQSGQPGRYGGSPPPSYGAPGSFGAPPSPNAPPSPSGLPPIGARPSGRSRRYIIYVFWVIEILILIRLILLLMDANPSALFSGIVYAVTEPLVIVFQNVFPSPSGQGHQLEAASVLALIVYPLLLWGVLRLQTLLRRRAAI